MQAIRPEQTYMYRNLGNVCVNNLRVKKFLLKYFRGKVNHENLAHENLHCTVFCCCFYMPSEKPEDLKMPVFMVIMLGDGYARRRSQQSCPLYAKSDCPAVWNSPKTSTSVLLFAEGYF